MARGSPGRCRSSAGLPQALTAAIATEIERAASQARGEIEGRLVQAQAEAAELATAGEALESERDELAEQVAILTTERDTLAGKAAQQAVDGEAQQRIEREQQAAEAARIEVATACQDRGAGRLRGSVEVAKIERLRVALADAQQGRTAAEQQAAVLAAKLEACADRVSRAEARADQIEQQVAKAAQVYDTARAAAAQETRQAQTERDEARKTAAEATRAGCPAGWAIGGAATSETAGCAATCKGAQIEVFRKNLRNGKGA